MKQHDYRLAGAVIVAWFALYVAQALGQTFLWLVWLCVGALVFSVFFIWRQTWLSLPIVVTVVVLFSYLVRAPYREEKWQTDNIEYTGALAWISNLHDTLVEKSEEFPGFGAQLIPGLTVGDDRQVSETLQQAMQVSSLSHLTAISGANCSMVIATVVTVVAFLRGGRYLQAVLGFAALITYVLIVGPEPSVLRASVMATVVLIAMVMGRPGIGIAILSGATVTLLFWDPWLSREIGFLLSVVATAGLIIFAQPLTQKLAQWMPAPLAALVAIPLAAQLVSQPFVALISPYLSTYGLLANMLTAPVAPLATILGLLVSVIIVSGIPLVHVVLWVQWLPATWIAYTAMVITELPQSRIPLPGPIGGMFFLALFAVSILVFFLHPHKKLRVISGITLFSLVSLSITATLWSSATRKTWIPADWNIAACDVGQGDALVLRSGEQYALIDTGKYPERLSECLGLLDVDRFEFIVFTHFDQDHVGGRSAVVNKTENVIVGLPEDKKDDAVITELQLSGINVVPSALGMTGNLGDATWAVVWPGSNYPSMERGNSGSVTVYVDFGKFDALFTGDLGADAQDAVMAENPLANVDVVKVSHHGSKDQSPRFYQHLNPLIALFSVGKENSYGHPTALALDMFSRRGALTPRTDDDGLILVGIHGDKLKLWSER